MTRYLPKPLPHCDYTHFCADCRELERGRTFRAGVLERQGIECHVDFECPKKKPWSHEAMQNIRIDDDKLPVIAASMPDPDAFIEDVKLNAVDRQTNVRYLEREVYDAIVTRHQSGQGSIGLMKKPKPTLKKIKTLFQAMLQARKVPIFTRQKRAAKCTGCDLIRKDPTTKKLFCSVCGCASGGGTNKIVNLTVYEENLPKWGCKHPKRGQPKPNGGTYGWDE